MRKIFELVLSLILLSFLLLSIHSNDCFLLAPVSFVPTQQILLLWNRLKNRKYDGTGVNARNDFSDQFDANVVELVGKVKALVNDYINRKNDVILKKSHDVDFDTPTENQLRTLSDGKYLCIDLSRYITAGKLVTEQLNNAFLIIKGQYSNRFNRSYSYNQLANDSKTYEFSIWRQKLVVDTYRVGLGRNLDAFLHSYDLTNQYEYYAFDYSSSEPDHYFNTNELNRYDLRANSYWFTDNLCIDSYLGNERTKHVKSTVVNLPFIPDPNKRAFAYHKLIKEGVLDNIKFYDYNVRTIKILRAAEHIAFGEVNQDNYQMVFMDLLYSSMPTKTENMSNGNYKRYMYPYFYIPTVFYYESFELDHHNNAHIFNYNNSGHFDPLLNHKVFHNIKTYGYFYPMYHNGTNWVIMNANLDVFTDLFGYKFVMPGNDDVEFKHAGFGGSFSYGMTLKYLPNSKYRYGTYFTPYYTSEYIVSGYASAAMMHFYGSQDAVEFGLGSRKTYMQNKLNINDKHFISHKTSTIPTGLMPMYQEFYPIYLIDSYCFVEDKKEAILLKPPTFSRYTLTPRQYNFHFRIPFGIQENERRDNTVLRAYAQANSYYHINPPTMFSNVTPSYAYFTALSDYHTMLPPFNRTIAYTAIQAVIGMNVTLNNINTRSILFYNKSLINNETRSAILTNFLNWVNYPGSYSPSISENMIRDNYLFSASPTNIRGLLWSNVYFRKIIEPGVASEMGFNEITMPTDDDSLDSRLRRVAPEVQPFGITNAPVRVNIGEVVETPMRLWRMNIYSGSMNRNYIGSNANERFFQHRAIALALMSYTLAVPDYPASPTIPWCWQSFDSMLSYAPESGAEASKYGLGYEYRFAYFHNDIHPVPGMLLSLGDSNYNLYRLPLFTYNHLLPLFFVVLTDRRGYWQQGVANPLSPSEWLYKNGMNIKGSEPTYLYIVPPDYIYNLKLPGPIRSISTHKLTSSSLRNVYMVARYEFFAPYLPLYPFRDVNTILPRFDIKPHLKAFNIYRDVSPNDTVNEVIDATARYKINNPDATSTTVIQKLRGYGYYNSFLGYFFVDIGGSFVAIERIKKIINLNSEDSNFENLTIRYLVTDNRVLVDPSNHLWGTDFNPFYMDAGSVFLTSEVRYDRIRERLNDVSAPNLPPEERFYVITMNGLTNLMFTYNNDTFYYGYKLWSTFDDFRSYYINNYNIIRFVSDPLYYFRHVVQLRFFAYSVLRTIALTNRIFFPNVRVRPLLGMTVNYGNNYIDDEAFSHIAYFKIYDDIVTKSSYYQTDLLTPMYITYNPLGAYVMVHEKDRDYIRRLMNYNNPNFLPSTNTPDPVPFNASFDNRFYNNIYWNYELIGPWNFHNLLFPTVSTGEVRQPQAWAFSHPRMWPRPIMAYYYPSRVTPNPAYYLSGIIEYEEKTYSGRRPYHVLDYRNRKDFVVVIRLYKLNGDIVAESLNNDFVAVYHNNKVYLRTKTQFIEPIAPRTLKGTSRVRHSLMDLVSNTSSNIEKFEAIVGGRVLSDLVSGNSDVAENYITIDYLHPIEDGVSAGSAYYVINEASIINCFGDIHQANINELAFCDRTTYPYDKDKQDIGIIVPDDYDYETTAFGWSEAIYVKFKTEDVFTKAADKDFEVNRYRGKIKIVTEHPISYGIIDNIEILKRQRDYITMMSDINYLSYDKIGSKKTMPAIKKAEHMSLISNRFDNLTDTNVFYNLPRTTNPDEFPTHYQRLIFEIDLPAQTLQYSQFSDALRYGKSNANTSYISTTDGVSIYNDKDLANVMLHEFERFDEPMIVYDNPYNPKNVLFMFIDNLTAERANTDVLNGNSNVITDNFINVGPNPFSGFWHMEYVGFITDYAWNKWSTGLDAEPRLGLLQNMNKIYEGFSNVYFYKFEQRTVNMPNMPNMPNIPSTIHFYLYGKYRIDNDSSVTFAQDGITLADYRKLHQFTISALSLNAFAPFLDFTVYNNYFGGTPKTVYYSEDYTPNNLYLPSSYYNNNYPDSLNINEIRNSLYRFRVEDIDVQSEDEKFLFPAKDIVTRLFSFRLPVVTNMVFVKDELPRYRIYPTSTLHLDNNENVYDKGFYSIFYDYSLGNVPKWPRDHINLRTFYGINQSYFYYNVITPSTNIQNTLVSQFNTSATSYSTVEYNNDPQVTSVGVAWSGIASNMKRLVYVVPPKPFDESFASAYDVFCRIGNLFAWPYDLIGANVQAECYYKRTSLFDYNLKAWYWPYIGRYAENLMHLNAQRAAFSPFTGYGYWMRYSNTQNIVTPVMAFWFTNNPIISATQVKFSVNSEYGYSYGRVVNPYKDFVAYERPVGASMYNGFIDNSLILNSYTRNFPNSNNSSRLSVVSDICIDIDDNDVFNKMILKTSAAIEIPQGFIYNMLVSNFHPPVPLFAVHRIRKGSMTPADRLVAHNITLNRTNYGRWISSEFLYTNNYVCFDTPPYGIPLGGSFYMQQYMLSNVPLYFYYNDENTPNILFRNVHFNQELSLKHFIPPELYYLISYPIFLTNEQVADTNLDLNYQYEPFYMSIAKLNLVYIGTQKFYPLVSYGIPYVELFYPFTELGAQYNEKSISEKFSPDVLFNSKTLYKYPFNNFGYKNRGMPMYSIYIDGQYDFNHTPSNASGNMAISQSAMLSYLQKDYVNYNDPIYTPENVNFFNPSEDFYKFYTYYDATIVRNDIQFMSFLENNRSALAMAASMNFLAGTSPYLKTSDLVLRKLHQYYQTDTMSYDMLMFYFHAQDEEHTSYRLDRIGVLGHPKDQNTKVTTNFLNMISYSPNTISNIEKVNNTNNIYTTQYYNLAGSYSSTKMVLERDIVKKPIHQRFGIMSDYALRQLTNNINKHLYITNRLIYEDLLLHSYHYRSYVPLPNEGIYMPKNHVEFNLMLNQSVSAKALFFVGNPYYIRSELANKVNIYFVYNDYKVLSQFYKRVRSHKYRVKMPMVKGLRVSVGVMPLGHNATHAYSVGPAGAVGARNYSQYTDRQFGEYHLPARETTNFSSAGSMPTTISKNIEVKINNVIRRRDNILPTAQYIQSPKSLFHTITNITRTERVVFWARNPYLIDVLTIYPKPLIIDPVSIYQKEALSCASLYLSDYLTYVPYGALGIDSPNAVSWMIPDAYPERNSRFINSTIWPNAVIDNFIVGDLLIKADSFPVGAVVESCGIAYDKWSYHVWALGFWYNDSILGAQHLPVPRRWLNHMVMYTNTLPMLSLASERCYYHTNSSTSYLRWIHQLYNAQTFFLSMYSNPTHTMLYLSHVLGSSAYNNKVVHELRFDMDLLYNLTDTVTYNNYWPHMQHTEVNMREENINIKKFLISPHHYYTVKALLEHKYYDLYRLNAETLINYNKYDNLNDTPINFVTGVINLDLELIRDDIGVVNDDVVSDDNGHEPYYDLFLNQIAQVPIRDITQVKSLYWTKRDLIFTTTYNMIDHAYNPNYDFIYNAPFYGIHVVSDRFEDMISPYEWLGGLYFILNSKNYIINHSVSESLADSLRVQPQILMPEATYVPVFYTFNTSLSTRRLSLYRTAIFASDIEPTPVFQHKGASTLFSGIQHNSPEHDIVIANTIFNNSTYNIDFDNVVVSNRMQTPLNDMYSSRFAFNLFCNTSPNASFIFQFNIPTDWLFYTEFNGFGRFEYNMNYSDFLIRNPIPWSLLAFYNYRPISKFFTDSSFASQSAIKLLGDDINMLFRFRKEMRINITANNFDELERNLQALSSVPLFVSNYSMWYTTGVGYVYFCIAVDAFSQKSYVDVAGSPDASFQLNRPGVNILGVSSPGLIPRAFNMTYNTKRYNIWNFTHRIDYFWFSWVFDVHPRFSTARSHASMFRTIYGDGDITTFKQPVLRANTISHYMYDPLYLDTGRVFIRPRLYRTERLYSHNLTSNETSSSMPFFVIADAIYMFAPGRYRTDSSGNRLWREELYSFDHLSSSDTQFHYMDSLSSSYTPSNPNEPVPPGYHVGSNVFMRPYGGYDQAIIKQGTGASVANFYHLVEAEPSMTRLWSIQCGLNTAPLTRTGDELTHEYGVPVSNNHMITSHGLHYEATIVDYFLGNMFLYRENDNSLYEGHPLPHPNFIIFGKSDNIYKFLGNPVPEVTYSAPPMSYTIEIGLRLYTTLHSSDGTINRNQYQDITIRPYQKHLSFSTDTSVRLPHTYSYERLLQNSCFAQHAFPAMVRNKHDIDYHHQAEYVFSNGGIFSNIASSYMKAIAQNPD